MSLTTSELSPADIAAVTGNRGNNGFGYGDGFLYWIIILFFFGMFNGNGWNGNGNSGNGMSLYPWMNQSNQMNDGFRDQMLYGQINGIQNSITSGFGDVATALCGGFAGVNATINNAQMANMQQAFAQQTAMNQGFNGLQAQLAQCCCDNRLATCQTQNIIQNEGNVTRFADANNTRDIIQSQNQGFQSVLDKLCQLELDGLKADNANLRTQLNFANLQASQVAQTAELRQSGATQLNQLVSELRSCPIPAQPVYGSQPIFTCGGNSYGCSGCGCGA